MRLDRSHAANGAASLRIYERVDGRGTVYDGERVLTEVDYAIRDVEETHTPPPARGATPTGEPPPASLGQRVGQRNIYGLVKSSDPRVRILSGYVGSRLALRLHDGRRLPFTVAKVLAAHAFLIQGLGGFQ